MKKKIERKTQSRSHINNRIKNSKQYQIIAD